MLTHQIRWGMFHSAHSKRAARLRRVAVGAGVVALTLGLPSADRTTTGIGVAVARGAEVDAAAVDKQTDTRREAPRARRMTVSTALLSHSPEQRLQQRINKSKDGRAVELFDINGNRHEVSLAQGEGGVASPDGTTYSVSHLIGNPVTGVCFLIGSGVDNDIVTFDGIAETTDPDIVGTVPTVTEMETANPDGTSSISIWTSSPTGTDLFPGGFTDPTTGALLTEACWFIGNDDLLDWPPPPTVLSASLTFTMDGVTVAGPFNVMSFFSVPWDGFFGVALPDATGTGINDVHLDLLVEKGVMQQCGNNIREGTEQCDGTGDTACPGLCQLDCTCPPPTCGDPAAGDCCIANGTPACNDATCCNAVCACDPFCCGLDPASAGFWDDNCAGPNDFVPGCSALDLCLACAPVCGNNIREGTEDCDGTDDAACPGLCQANCTCGGPINDGCANSIAIFDGVTPFSTVGATTDGPAHPGHPACDAFDVDQVVNDIWYDYVATCTGDLTVTTCEELGGSADYDTRIAIYAPGCPATSGSLIDCNDDDPTNPCGGLAGGFHSTLTVPVTSGQALLIRIGGFNGDGTGSVNITCAGDGGVCGPGNGDCCVNNGTPGCDDATCCNAVCAIDPFCCGLNPVVGGLWGAICANEAIAICTICGGTPPVCGNNVVELGEQCDGTDAAACPGQCQPDCTCSSFVVCGDPAAGNCCMDNVTPGCNDATCCNAVCTIDPFCCGLDPVLGGLWDNFCADAAATLPNECPACIPEACCLPDGSCGEFIPDLCCQQNGVPLGPGSVCEGDADMDGIDDACEVLGDLNGDRGVDLVDWLLFMPSTCLQGPGASVGPACNTADLNGDGRVDMQDVQLFWNAFTGPFDSPCP